MTMELRGCGLLAFRAFAPSFWPLSNSSEPREIRKLSRQGRFPSPNPPVRGTNVPGGQLGQLETAPQFLAG